MIFSKYQKGSACVTNGGSFRDFVDCLEQRHSDVQGNTHAFGVILLELISGRPPYCKDGGCLEDWVSILSISYFQIILHLLVLSVVNRAFPLYNLNLV